MARDRYLQSVRGMAIIAVVLIHCLPKCDASVAVRPFLNWAVAVFFFLSGIFSVKDLTSWGGALKHKFFRTLIPYVVWSLVYALILRGIGVRGALKSLITADASAQMYFIAVYVQLMLLAPLLYRLLRHSPLIAYAITPLSLAAYEALTVFGVALPILGRLFPVWLIFYVMGLDWERWRTRLQDCFRVVLIAFFVCLAFQVVFGFLWLYFGDYNMATTQLKLSSMASSVCAIVIIMLIPASIKRRLSRSLLADVGDHSFGIYLCHLFVLSYVARFLAFFALPILLETFMLFTVTFGLSLALCVFFRRVMSRWVAKAVGTA